jgi:predicted PhzF superfamily epimerase YddE/YHI9
MSGVLVVNKNGDYFEMDFPARNPSRIAITEQMSQAIGSPVAEAYLSRDLLLLVESEQQVRDIVPSFDLLEKLPDCFAVIITAKGDRVDFVSRFFAPGAGIPEDPATGSSHCTLIPFWAQRLNKDKMIAEQLSRRGGSFVCEYCGDRVKIAGKAVLYLQGEIIVED